MKSYKTKNDLNYHIVYSTKNRNPNLTVEHFIKMRDCAKEKAHEIGVIIHALNGWKDHMHILISIPPKLSVSYVVKMIKGYLSYKMPDVYWQNGYGVFCVEQKNLEVISNYIFNQKQHHENESDERAA